VNYLSKCTGLIAHSYKVIGCISELYVSLPVVVVMYDMDSSSVVQKQYVSHYIGSAGITHTHAQLN
jgi:hypothetical protein